VAAFCTAFLVGGDLIATAGHCANVENLRSFRVVFGFQMAKPSQPVLSFADREVYEPAEILGRAEDKHGADWAIVRLSREVAGRTPLTMRSQGKITNSSALYVIGHPKGLPAKYAASAVVRDNRPGAYFVTNLDTYGGNSGSPVFNAVTGDVEGILVRGDRDLILTEEGCRRSRVCPDLGCLGEEVTRIREIGPSFLQGMQRRTSGRGR
jgi:V8-like Glu-specific endopeptidase